MQRIGLLVVGLLVLGGSRATAQQATGTTLWRVAATTLATPPAVDASGVIATVRVPAGSVGQVGVLFGRMGLSDISQTIDSPDPTGAVIPVYTFAGGVTWWRLVAGTSVGATLAFHETRLDNSRADRWTMDVGASRTIGNDRLRLAAATHFFSSLKSNDPSQDVYAGIEGRIWSGPLSGDRVVVRGRYGISFAHGFAADHQFGAGAEFSKTVALDLMLAREGSYGDRGASWRPVAGVRIAIGKYRITLARDAGVNDLGSAYR